MVSTSVVATPESMTWRRLRLPSKNVNFRAKNFFFDSTWSPRFLKTHIYETKIQKHLAKNLNVTPHEKSIFLSESTPVTPTPKSESINPLGKGKY